MCENVPLTDMREKREDKKSLGSTAQENRSAALIAQTSYNLQWEIYKRKSQLFEEPVYFYCLGDVNRLVFD
jgi:hypothetical protein